MLHAVILAGGSGRRFWPASRDARPKQVLPLLEGRPLVAVTRDRLPPLVPLERTWVVTGPAHAGAVSDALGGFPPERLLVEPEARNTAPSIALACAVIAAQEDDATLAVMPSDHAIASPARFRELLAAADALAREQPAIVLLGIRPGRPATGYGYLEAGQVLPSLGGTRARRVVSFHEKPDLATARTLVEQGGWLWNSGIFVGRTTTFLEESRRCLPDLARGIERMEAGVRADGIASAAVRAGFLACPSTSFDYGVMEHASNVLMIEADVGWDDLGSFASVAAAAPKDAEGNSKMLAPGVEALFVDSRDCFVYGEAPGLTALLGLEGVIVVRVQGVTLVCPAARGEEVRKVVEALERLGRRDLL